MATELIDWHTAVIDGDVHSVDDLPPEDRPDTSSLDNYSSNEQPERPESQGVEEIKSNLDKAYAEARDGGHNRLAILLDGKYVSLGLYVFVMSRRAGLTDEERLEAIQHADSLSQQFDAPRSTAAGIGGAAIKGGARYNRKPWEGHDSASRAAGDY